MSISNPSNQGRMEAAAFHLGYLPVGLALIVALIHPAASLGLLAFSVLWTLGAWAVYNMEPQNAFVRDHLEQARKYHRRGLSAGVCAVALTIYFTFFTWGLATPIALIAGPIALVAWMIPTWKAAAAASRGELFRYEAVQLTPGKADHRSFLSQREATAVSNRIAFDQAPRSREFGREPASVAASH